jgi:AraC family transcriptional regulator
MERPEATAPDPESETSQDSDHLASSLDRLLKAARRELERDQQAAKASLATALLALRSEIERCSGPRGPASGGLAGWQIARVQAFVEENLDRTIQTTDLSAVARRSRAHFSRAFKKALGETPHAYVVRRRLEKACHLMIATSGSLTQIALAAGFADSSHFVRVFRQAFGQTPSHWRRERATF